MKKGLYGFLTVEELEPRREENDNIKHQFEMRKGKSLFIDLPRC